MSNKPNGNSNQNFFDLLREGTQALQRGKTSTAIPLLEQAHQIDPENSDVILNLAGAYVLTKKFKQAAALLEPLSEQDPNNPMVWTNLGAAYLGNPILARDEHHDKAIAAFKKAIKINPKTPHVAYNLGLIYRDRKEYDDAIHWFKQALRANPGDGDAQYYIDQLTEEKNSL